MLDLKNTGRITRERLLKLLSDLLSRHLRLVHGRDILLVRWAFHVLLLGHSGRVERSRIAVGRHAWAHLAILLALITAALRVVCDLLRLGSALRVELDTAVQLSLAVHLLVRARTTAADRDL